MAAPGAAPNLELPVDNLMTSVADDAADRRTEKDRIKAIMCCAEAAGREALATHLALATGLSFEDAKAALLASPQKQTDTASTPESARVARARQADEAFTKVFRRAEYAIPDSPEEPVSVVARMQANYALAQGLPPRK
jgi:hypothetical protein